VGPIGAAWDGRQHPSRPQGEDRVKGRTDLTWQQPRNVSKECVDDVQAMIVDDDGEVVENDVDDENDVDENDEKDDGPRRGRLAPSDHHMPSCEPRCTPVRWVG
jgi:hypothetical protein